MTAWYKTKRATTVEDVGGMRVCYYHDTPVVSWNEKKIVLVSNGFHTVTTKSRMNQVAQEYDLDYSVYQDKSVWYVNVPKKPSSEQEAGIWLLADIDAGRGAIRGWLRRTKTLPFEDGMTIER